MLCVENCYKTIVEALQKAPGVEQVTLVDFDQGMIRVDYSDSGSTTEERDQFLVKTVERLGYEAAVDDERPVSVKEIEMEVLGMTW